MFNIFNPFFWFPKPAEVVDESLNDSEPSDEAESDQEETAEE